MMQPEGDLARPASDSDSSETVDIAEEDLARSAPDSGGSEAIDIDEEDLAGPASDSESPEAVSEAVDVSEEDVAQERLEPLLPRLTFVLGSLGGSLLLRGR